MWPSAYRKIMVLWKKYNSAVIISGRDFALTKKIELAIKFKLQGNVAIDTRTFKPVRAKKLVSRMTVIIFENEYTISKINLKPICQNKDLNRLKGIVKTDLNKSIN